jgi:hypothetical protein
MALTLISAILKEIQQLYDNKTSAKDRQAVFDWAHSTAPRRTVIAGMFRQAAASR